MKSSVMAVVLNCILPGAGLLYLCKPLWAFINLLTVAVAAIVLVFILPAEVIHEYFHYFVLACSAGSGGLAHNVASRLKL